MKTITLIRHAKSSWEYDVSDIDRPLSTRGVNDANLLSKKFIEYSFEPDAIFSSPANRALTTCNIFIDNLNVSKKLLSVDEKLYDFGGHQVAKFINNLSDQYNKVMIFGHNHAFTAIANSCGSTYIDNVPTCGLVMIEFEVDYWADVKKGITKMTIFPRDLKD